MTRTVSACLIASVAVLAAAQTAAAQSPPTRPGEGWVVLSVDEYRTLRGTAAPAKIPTPPPDLRATVSRVEYELTVDGPAATGQVRVTADVFAEEWVFVPIPPGLRVRHATVQGRTVAIVNDPAGGRDAPRSVLLSRPGRHVIVLEVAVPVASASGSDSISLPPSPAPVQRALVMLPAAGAALAVSGGLVEQRTASSGGTRFAVSGRPRESMVLTWGRRSVAPAAGRPLRLRGSVTSLVGLGEDAAQVSAQVTLDVVEGTLDRVSLKVPPDFVVGQVSGALVADWDLQRDNTLVVALLEAVEKSTNLTLTGEVRCARDGRLPVPLVRLAGAERETGGVAVEVLGAGEITNHEARALEPADASDLSDVIGARRSPALVAFRYRPQPWDAERSLAVAVARYTAQAVLLANVDEARYRVLLTEDGKALVEATFALRNSQRSFLGVSLPAGAELWAASVDGRPVRPGRAPEGALLLPILKDRADGGTRSSVQFAYLTRGPAWPGEGGVLLQLPALDLPVSRSGLLVHYSPRYRLNVEAGVFREQEYVPPTTDALRGRAAEAKPAPASASPGRDERGVRDARDLAATYRRTAPGRTRIGVLPVDIPFPSLGPRRFLSAALTPEGTTVQVRFTVKRQVN